MKAFLPFTEFPYFTQSLIIDRPDDKLAIQELCSSLTLIRKCTDAVTNLSYGVTKLPCTHNHFHLKDKSFGNTGIHQVLKHFLFV